MTATADQEIVDAEIVPPAPIKVSEPGVYYDIPEHDYHLDCVAGGSLSSTGARTLTNKTPAHFAYERGHGRKDKTAFDVGTAFHTAFLSRGKDIEVIEATDWRTDAAKTQRDRARAAGRTPLLIGQAEQVTAMVESAARHRTVGPLFRRTDWHPEVTFVGRDPETGVMCRVRVDLLLPVVDGEPVEFIDMKTTDDASKAGMEHSMVQWGYPQQLDHYACTIRWALGLDPEHPVYGSLIAVEKPEPHLVGLGQPDEQSLAYAHEDNRLARHLYARCAASGDWSAGYSDEFVPLSLPGWRIYQHEARYGPSHVFDPETYFSDDDFEVF